MNNYITATLLCAATIGASSAQAAETVTFGGGTYSTYTGSTVEGSFTYYVAGGELFHGTEGAPGGDMEGRFLGGGGILGFTSATGMFTFTGLDYAAYEHLGVGSQTLVVNGFLGASLVGSERFTLANASTYLAGSPYTNWTGFSALALASKNLDRLEIMLNAGSTPGVFFQAVDNVSFGDAVSAIPEPASWGMMILGLGAVGAAMRRRSLSLQFA